MLVCHGADEGSREAELRLDQSASATAKLESGNAFFQTLEIADDSIHRRRIVLFNGQTQELIGIAEPGRQLVEPGDHLLELGPFFSKGLRACGIVPDRGLLELSLHFGQALGFAFVVKDTPVTPSCVPTGR